MTVDGLPPLSCCTGVVAGLLGERRDGTGRMQHMGRPTLLSRPFLFDVNEIDDSRNRVCTFYGSF